jgi:hypothetical protein
MPETAVRIHAVTPPRAHEINFCLPIARRFLSFAGSARNGLFLLAASARYRIIFMPLYADTREMIEQDQKDDPAEYTNFVSLAGRVEAIEEEHHSGLAKPSKEDLKEFWQDETTIGVDTPTARHKRSAPKK